MKTIRQHLEKLRTIKRERHHPLIHQLHKKHNISRKTLFYIKEYGSHTNVPKTIVRESIKILLLASIVSSVGGFAMEQIKAIFLPLFPLIILLPVMNGMIGAYGTIISSKFSTMLHENKIKKELWANPQLKKLFVQVLIIAMLTALSSAVIAIIISGFSNYTVSITTASKVFFIVIVDVLLLMSILFLISVFSALYFYRKGEDPNNFLIPITTSVADFGNMVLLSIMVVLLF